MVYFLTRKEKPYPKTGRSHNALSLFPAMVLCGGKLGGPKIWLYIFILPFGGGVNKGFSNG